MASTRTVEETFYDFSQRRKGIVRALTTEADAFFGACHPDLDNLCLYGTPDGSWEVRLPCDEVPPELPEPALGINFARDGMDRRDWFSLIAVHSDAWLMSMAFFNAARLDADGRRLLFNEINALPTCLEVVLGKASGPGPISGAAQISKRPAELPSAYQPDLKRAVAEQSYAVPEDAQMGAQARVSLKSEEILLPYETGKFAQEDDEPADEEEEEDDEDVEYDPCPNCGREFRDGEFWIFCDFCQRWFDGKCVGMTAEKAKAQKKWKCPFCAAE